MVSLIDSLSFFVGRMIVATVRVPHLSAAGKTCNDNVGAVQPYPACSARNKIFFAVSAHPALQMCWDAHTVPHPDLFCQMDVTVA